MDTVEHIPSDQDQSIINTFFKTEYLKPEHKIDDDTEEIGDHKNNHLAEPSIRNEDTVITDFNNALNSDERIENAVKYGLNKVQELLTIKEPLWFKMGEFI